MTNPITLPLLDALDYLYDHNLTIDKLWTETPPDGPPQTHITPKPKPIDNTSKDTAPNKSTQVS